MTIQPAVPALPLSEADEWRIELDQLRVEVAKLRPIAAAAFYVRGPAVCVFDRECEEYGDGATGEDLPDVEWCSHVELRHATWGAVFARSRLESLLDEIRLLVDKSTDGIGAEVRTALHEGLYSIGYDLEDEFEVDTSRNPYKAVLDEEARTTLTPERTPAS